MIDTLALRKKVIDLAIQGTLTEQLPDDGNSDALYNQILENKHNLIKKGKIKRNKELPPITEEEMPFDIPRNWKWIRWGDAVNIVSARRVHQVDWRKEGIPFYRAREIAILADAGKVDNELFISEELYDKFSESGVPQPGDLMVTGVGTLGKTYVVKENDKFYYKDASVLCFENFASLVADYLKRVMESTFMRSQIESNSGGTTVDTLTMVRMNQYLMPLPPLEEQKRIVEVLDNVFEQITIIDELQTKYNNNLIILRNKIIDAGIQGKLTEQLESDGNSIDVILNVENERKKQEDEGIIKAVKKQNEISEEDIPFKIPDNWKWVRLGNVAYIVRGGSPRPIKQYITNDPNGINWIKIGDVEKGGKYIIETKEKIIPAGEKKSRKVYPGDFLLTNSMSFGRPYISKIEGCIHDGWLLIHDLKAFNQDYLYYLLSSGYLYEQFCKKASGATVDNLNIDKVSSAIIPLPPLAEQKRIADKLDSILSYI